MIVLQGVFLILMLLSFCYIKACAMADESKIKFYVGWTIILVAFLLICLFN